MRSTFHPLADIELTAAARWYHKKAGIGEDFIDAVFNAITEIERHPTRYPVPSFYRGRHNVHRLRLARYEYSIVYQILSNRILVIAVAHPSRRPTYWAKRLG